jgi:Zn finger protein HypA/HybF involved in hydrogenase expression
MKRALSVLLVVVGVALLLLGLIFFAGAAGLSSRYVFAAVSLAAGAALAGFGVRWFRAADADAPEQVLAEILEAARRRNGEVAELEVVAALGRRAPLAPPILEKLVQEKLCERKSREGATYYLFRDLQPRLFVRKCEFCAAEMSIASTATKCPRCGGAVASAVARRAVSDGAYRMDE